MQNIFTTLHNLRAYWIGALGGLLITSAVLGYRLHSQHKSYQASLHYSINLAISQLQLLEAEFKPDTYLRGLYDEFGETAPGPVNEHIDTLVQEHEWIRRGVAEATIENLVAERATIADDHAAASYYDRVLELAALMYLENIDAPSQNESSQANHVFLTSYAPRSH